MYRLLIAIFLALAFSTTSATPIAKAPNVSGGHIVLTERICQRQNLNNGYMGVLHYAYATHANGEVHHGCYYLDTTSNEVQVFWYYPVNQLRIYSPLIFQLLR